MPKSDVHLFHIVLQISQVAFVRRGEISIIIIVQQEIVILGNR